MGLSLTNCGPSQVAIADAKRNKMTDAYAPIREAAKKRQGTRNDLKDDIKELIPECSEDEPLAPQTRDIRAKAAGPGLDAD